MVLYLFDLLYLDGRDLRPSPLVERKAALAALLRDTERPLRYSEHFEEDGELVLRHACRLSLEGVVRSEEHTSELQSLMRISYAVFCLKKKTSNYHRTPKR